MKQTEQQYAEGLIERYKKFIYFTDYEDFTCYKSYTTRATKCAIIDVENTIDAMYVCDCHFVESDIYYYQNVLQILKDKL